MRIITIIIFVLVSATHDERSSDELSIEDITEYIIKRVIEVCEHPKYEILCSHLSLNEPSELCEESNLNLKNPGEECNSNSECISRACALTSAEEDSFKVCCNSTDTILYGKHRYCTNLPINTVCWNDEMCSSSNCKGNRGGDVRGVCKFQSVAGEHCEIDEDCANDHCGYDDKSRLICCPSGDSIYPFDNTAFCTQIVPLDHKCLDDLQCEIGLFCKRHTKDNSGVCSGINE